MATAKTELRVEDILDVRAYERVRESFRREVIARKRRRRVPVGPIVTVVFECEDTVRFQVQEMARVERIASDEGIQAELDVYNRLLPAPGELSATLFIELTTEEDLRRWLPQLVGIERSVFLDLGTAARDDGAGPRTPAESVRSAPEAAHAQALTREAVTPAVHYLRFPFSAEQVTRFAAGPVDLSIRHPAYEASTELSDETVLELAADLEGRPAPTLPS